MRRLLFPSSYALAVTFVLCGLCQRARAQEPATPSPANAADAGAEAVSPEPASPPGTEAEGAAAAVEEPATPEPPPENPRVLEPPNLGPLNVEPNEAGPRLPDPSQSADRLQQAAPVVPEKRGWTMPETIFHLHGYMRLRGNYLRDGALGHQPLYDRLPSNESTVMTPPTATSPATTTVTPAHTSYDPFPFFAPDDSTTRQGGTVVAGGCNKASNGTGVGQCDRKGQVSGDMRLRLKPEIHLSDDVRVKAWIDVMDNVGVGTLGYSPGTQPAALSTSSAMRARRVWGEARNRDIGELRFGRMGADWGLGILDNGGDRYGIDSDFSTELDRVMGITNLAGFYLMAAYDWASEGKVLGKTQSPSGVPIDQAQRDDRSRFTFAAAHKLDAEVQQSALARGELVFNYGVYFVYTKQFLQSVAGPNRTPQTNFADGVTTTGSADPIADDVNPTGSNSRYVRLGDRTFTPDLWLQLLWNGLRVELEAAFVAGSREGGCPQLLTNAGASNPSKEATEQLNPVTRGSCKYRQLGLALETEYRLFDERLGIFFNSGYASGDSNAYGLAATNNPNYQRTSSGAGTNRTISTYTFHPDYRVDLILWRTIMQRVAGAYYFKPGVSYDFIRDPYGQLAGARVDAVYSRASAPKQTWGDSGNLGLELDLSLYYRSEDGPDAMDGFYGMVQYGILFPFQGLDYNFSGAPKSSNAMILRGVAGIAF
ncbi:MAG: hypothetical protein JWN48_5188 [Myxococcaceae bacterium]|nr:hypothetical protein [Myxococcaceae bacterium]